MIKNLWVKFWRNFGLYKEVRYNPIPLDLYPLPAGATLNVKTHMVDVLYRGITASFDPELICHLKRLDVDWMQSWVDSVDESLAAGELEEIEEYVEEP